MMKEALKVPKSKAYTFYLLHNDLTRKLQQRELTPETRRPTCEQFTRTNSPMWQNNEIYKQR